MTHVEVESSSQKIDGLIPNLPHFKVSLGKTLNVAPDMVTALSLLKQSSRYYM